MEFVHSVQSEVLKIKGSRILLITVLGGLFLSLIFTIRFIAIGSHINLSDSTERWELLFRQNARPFLGFIIPIGAMLICTLITQVEYSNNNWKQVHTTPQRLTSIFFAKFIILFVLAVMVFCMLNIGVLSHGILPCLILDGKMPRFAVPTEFFALETLICFIFTLPIIAFQYMLSLHFKNFMVAIGVGLTVYVGSMPGVKLGMIGYLSPYSFVLNYFDQVITTTHCWMALAYFGVLLILSYYLYIHKSEKG